MPVQFGWQSKHLRLSLLDPVLPKDQLAGVHRLLDYFDRMRLTDCDQPHSVRRTASLPSSIADRCKDVRKVFADRLHRLNQMLKEFSAQAEISPVGMSSRSSVCRAPNGISDE